MRGTWSSGPFPVGAGAVGPSGLRSWLGPPGVAEPPALVGLVGVAGSVRAPGIARGL